MYSVAVVVRVVELLDRHALFRIPEEAGGVLADRLAVEELAGEHEAAAGVVEGAAAVRLAHAEVADKAVAGFGAPAHGSVGQAVLEVALDLDGGLAVGVLRPGLFAVVVATVARDPEKWHLYVL